MARPSTVESSAAYKPGYEVVAEHLLKHIQQSDLRPGDRLPTERGIAELFGVTRTVARDAVKILTAMGRLSVRRGAGIFVASPDTAFVPDAFVQFQPTDIDQIRQLLDFRSVIEAETVRLAAGVARPTQVSAIRQAAEDSVAAASREQVGDFGRADVGFHNAIADAAGNVFLSASVRMFRKLAAQSDMLVFHGEAAGSFSAAAQQHVEIAEAVAAGDAETAAAIMIDHIETTKHQFEQRLNARLSNSERVARVQL